VTLRWNTIVGRLSASILTTLELTDWVADSIEQYVQIAIDKARDLAALNTLRLSLRERLTSSVIGNTAAYVAAVEQEYRALWHRWCAQKNPAPSFADALAQHQAGRLIEAQTMYQAILRQQPDHADALHLLGALAQQQGDHAAAVEYISRAIRIKPSAQMHYNLGVALQAQDNLDAAIENYRQAVALKPDYVDAWSNLGSVQQAQDHLDAAVESYRQALALKPNLSACNNLGSTLNAQGKNDEAIVCYRQALALDPHCVKTWSNLGGTLQSQGKLDEAIAHFRRALEIKPEYSEAHSNLIFTLDLAAQCNTAALQEERKRWNAAHATPLLPQPLVHRNLPHPQRRLRIGYVSGDFKIHSAAAVFGAMLLHFNRAQFEVFAYSNAKTEDDYTRMFMQQVTCWRQISDLSDTAIADLIRADGIDILVDLSSHSAGNRLLVFARKPAPIQITAWGYATSTGLEAMDVFFADPVIVPEDEKALFTEEIRYLPNVVSFFSAMAYPPVNELPALSEQVITFGSFNRLTKISPQAYAVWAQVLHAVPNSRLLMKTAELSDTATAAQVTRYFTEAGIAPERIVLLGRTSWGEHVTAFNQVDLGLDPFPHGGGVTTLEGLMMGIPVVTLRWNTIVGRLSASILTTLELTDWIADSTEQYVQIAIDKARDLAALHALRLSLRERLTSSVIGNTAAYVAAVEQEYRALWHRWCAQKNPAPSFAEALAQHQAGRLVEAQAMYQAILRQQPDHAEVLHLLGTLAGQQGDHTGAVAFIRRAIDIQPSAQMHYHLGVTLQTQKQLDAAIDSYQRAVALKPDYATAWSNLGAAQQTQNNFDAAIKSYRCAIAAQPEVSAYNNLGSVLNLQNRVDEAIACYQQALALDPNCAKAWSNLGGTLQSQAKLDEAMQCFRRALEIQPGYVEAHSNLIFTLDLAAQCDTQTLQQERRRWNAQHALPLASKQQPHANSPQPQRRLRIGYVSADFRIHSAAAIFGAMLTRFDRARFEVFAYSNTSAQDDMTQLFMNQVTAWRNIVDLTDDAVATLIRTDGIDILVDLSGHSAGNRLRVFARKPAPIQITAWGYATSTGMAAMDVFFADPVVVPPDERKLFTETIRDLPNVVNYSSPHAFPPVNPLPALTAPAITFGAFNRLTKISAPAYDAWAQVLLAIPHSRLLFKTAELDDPTTRDQVARHFVHAGIARERIVMLGKSNWEAHVAAFGQVDIALDPFPHGGGVTTLEGLMMGVPVITLRWHTIVGRLSASILTTLGLTDWIAETPAQMADIAIRQTADLPALQTLRTSLRTRMMTSVIGDCPAYVAAVEQEYHALWEEWCAKQSTVEKRQTTAQN